LVPAQAFTPNGDGINDNWIIPGIENYSNALIKVYNRWGHEVFASKGYNNDWNATYKSNSDSLPSGSYMYVIDLANGTAPIQGWLFINY
jgi:gliding motility-associated-like protein